MAACRAATSSTATQIDADPKRNAALRAASARRARPWCPRGISSGRAPRAQGVTDLIFPEYDTDWDSEAYLTVAGQNSNNSVRVPNGFFDVLERGEWELSRRTDGKCPSTCQPRSSGTRSPTRRGLRRSRRAVRHHHQRVAHLPRGRAHQRLQPVRDRRHARRDRRRLAADRRPGGQVGADHRRRRPAPPRDTDLPDRRKPISSV